MSFPQIQDAHGHLVDAVKALAKPGAQPVPVSLVSVNNTGTGQLVVFDSIRWPPAEVAKRLRTAADFIEKM